jgi:hypothetical protein
MRHVYDDGGRAAAGFRGEADDCVARAIAIATELPYKQVYAELNELGQAERGFYNRVGRRVKSSARLGVFKPTTRAYMEALLGWVWQPTMGIGTGCTVHLRDGELPAGRLVVQVSRHLVAVVDGVVHDTFDPTRDGTRCVYGYYRKDWG